MNTLGEDDLGGHVKMRSFGAHFRVDMTRKVNYSSIVDIIIIMRVTILVLSAADLGVY